MLAGQRRLHFEDNARRAHVWMEWMCDSSSHFWLGGMAQGETWLSVRCSGAEVNSPCSAGKQVWKQPVWGQLSVCSVCNINHSPLPSIGWPVADLTAATGSNTLISERVSPFSQCQVGQQKRESGKKKKSMPAYLVGCHTTCTILGSVLCFIDTDAWAGSEFYAAGHLVNRFAFPCST